jgi:hypothetical protein
MEEYNIFDSSTFSFDIKKTYVSESKYITYSVGIRSDDFVGRTTFCISPESQKELILNITKLADSLEGTYRIQSYDDDSYIEVRVKDGGKLFINGQLGGSHQDHRMYFSNIADQTLLTNLIKYLNSAIK